MKVRIFVCSVGLLFSAACQSVSDATTSVRERLAAREAPKVKAFAADQRTTYEAVRTAAMGMGYRYTRGGAAQGEFDAINRVSAGEQMGSSRQLAMKVRLQNALAGGTEVTVKITEIIESDSSNRAGHATETALRDTPQYEVFFQRVGEVLARKE